MSAVVCQEICTDDGDINVSVMFSGVAGIVPRMKKEGHIKYLIH